MRAAPDGRHETAGTIGQLPRLEGTRELVETGCFLCGSTKSRTRFSEPPFRIVECDPCGLVYTTPRFRPEDLKAIYQVDYWRSESAKDYGYQDYLRDEPDYLKTFRRRSRLIDRFHRKPGRVLDVGCAAGYFLKVMKDKGWEPWGVEVSTFISDFARERFGLEHVLTGTLEDLTLPERAFDVVTLWDVLEHLLEPQRCLERIRPLLNKDGILVLETQNIDSLFARLLGKRWQHFKYFEHLYHFSPRTLGRLLDRCGFEVVENRPWLGGKYVSLGFIVERSARLSPLLRVALSPLRLLSRVSLYLNFLDEMIVVARPA